MWEPRGDAVKVGLSYDPTTGALKMVCDHGPNREKDTLSVLIHEDDRTRFYTGLCQLWAGAQTTYAGGTIRLPAEGA